MLMPRCMMPDGGEACIEYAEAVTEIERLRAELQDTAIVERYRSALHEIEAWSRAYPLKVFPEPDFDRARRILEASGMTLDAISASNMRHVVEGVGKIARDALKE